MTYTQARPITDKRGRVVHFSKMGFKPLCRPHTRVVFHAVQLGTAGTRLCETCAEREMRAQFDAAGLSGDPIDESEAA